MLRWILWIVAGLVGLVGLAAIVGLLLPKAHRASRTVTVPASPEKVFAIVTDFGRYASWRSDVRRVTVEGSGGTGTVVREENTSGTIPYRVKIRGPSFVNLAITGELCRNVLLADVPAIVGSIDIVMGEVDR